MVTLLARLVFARYVGGAVYLQAPVVLLYGCSPHLLCGGVRRTNHHLGQPERSSAPHWEAALVPAPTAGLG